MWFRHRRSSDLFSGRGTSKEAHLRHLRPTLNLWRELISVRKGGSLSGRGPGPPVRSPSARQRRIPHFSRGRIRTGRVHRPGAAATALLLLRCCCCPRMNCEILWVLHNYKTAGTFSLLSGASGTDFCTCIYKTKHLFLEPENCNNMSS